MVVLGCTMVLLGCTMVILCYILWYWLYNGNGGIGTMVLLGCVMVGCTMVVIWFYIGVVGLHNGVIRFTRSIINEIIKTIITL